MVRFDSTQSSTSPQYPRKPLYILTESELNLVRGKLSIKLIICFWLVIESDDTEPETVNEETANETEVENEKTEKLDDIEETEGMRIIYTIDIL